MKITLLILGGLVGLIICFVIYRLIKVNYQSKVINRLRWSRLKPLYDKLHSGSPVTEADVLPFAENVLTRNLTFAMLNGLKRIELFPEKYDTLVMNAESNLANWLEFPTELNACPDQMEYVKRASFDLDDQGRKAHYEVFRYRVNVPHWAAKYGWMVGVSGPFFDDSKPYEGQGGATFSRMETEGKISPDDEALWVHKHITMRRR